MFLKNKIIIFKIKRSKVTDFAALSPGGSLFLEEHKQFKAAYSVTMNIFRKILFSF